MNDSAHTLNVLVPRLTNLIQCFRYLGYIVEVHRNLTPHQIKTIFSFYRTCDYAQFDSFAFCPMVMMVTSLVPTARE